MKYFILFFIIGIEILAQSTPTYTPNYRFRKWTQGATPTADSINANWTGIDSEIKKRQDTIDTNVGKYWKDNTWTGNNTFSDTVTFSGTIINSGSSTWVTTNSSQTISGQKTFTGNAVINSKLRYTVNSEDIAGTPATFSYGYPLTKLTISAGSNVEITNFSGGTSGDMITIYNSNASYTVTLTDGGNFKLEGNAVLGQYDTIQMFYDGTYWIEISRSNN